jgi:hypothetical protein
LDAVTLKGVGHECEIQIALIEAFTIHARSLIAFLWDNTFRYGDGGLAAHYFEPGEWEGLRPPMERTLDGVRARVASEIAHISYARTRVTDDQKGWRYVEIAASIGRCLRVFIQNVPQRLVIESFRSRAFGTMPHQLRVPVAVSWPADHWPPSVASQSFQDFTGS